MAKIDLDSLNIEELAALRDAATEKLAQKVMARQAELEAELERLAQYGKLTKKALVAAPVPLLEVSSSSVDLHARARGRVSASVSKLARRTRRSIGRR